MEQNAELVRLARNGDISAFARLYEQIYKDLYRYALYILRNPTDAEDVVSEAVLDAFAAIKSLRSEEAFRAWMFRILSNKCKSCLREYARKYVDLEEAEEELSYFGEPAENLDIRKAFMELDDEERMIVGMHVFGGYTGREISKMFSMNANTVRTRERRALKKLAEKLGGTADV